MIEAYPLCWPHGWRSMGNFEHRDPSRFKINSFAKTRDALIHEVELLGGDSVVLSSNIPLRQDGLPYAKFTPPKNPGVAIYFSLSDKPMVLACDQYPKVEENMQSIRKTVEAIRGIKRWGASDMLERAFTGFKAIEAPKEKSCWEILEIPENSSRSVIESARREKAKIHHPDMGGSSTVMSKINDAYYTANELITGT